MGLRALYHRWLIRRHSIPDELWRRALRSTRYARSLPVADRQRLRELAALFLSLKVFEPVAGITVTPAMRAIIALKACVPILNLGVEYYSGWSGILVYPGDFRVREEYADENGVVHREVVDLCGQSLARGPMVLSWETIRDECRSPGGWQDLVVHECAHKLDTLNGEADGFPPLHAGMEPKRWTRDFRSAYQRLGEALEHGEPTRLDPYAASDPAEFFAVASETFFTAPHVLNEDFPAVYQQLAAFYRQDPRAALAGRRRC
jgi:Mlc titration factor MtfA (ptsG expression regulator)